MSTAEARLIAPTIPSQFVFDALAPRIQMGDDIEPLLLRAGLDLAELKAQGSRVSVLDYARLIELIILDSNDGFLGFLEEPIPVRAFSVVATQLAAVDNVQQLLTHMNRFYALFSDQFSWQIETKDEQCCIRLLFDERQGFDYRFIYQSLLLVAIRLIHWFVGEQVDLIRVCFTFSEANVGQHLHYLFGAPVQFLQCENAIYLPNEVMTLNCTCTLDQVQVMLRDSRRMMLVQNAVQPFTQQVRRALILNREQGWLSVEEIAQGMHLSTNQLWRKLKKEQTSFLEIRDDLKRDYALSLLRDRDLRVGEVAERLGFSEVSSFNKAFLKWVGIPPSQYRAQLEFPD